MPEREGEPDALCAVDGEIVELPRRLEEGRGVDDTEPLQLSVDVAAFEGGSEPLGEGVSRLGAQKGPMLGESRCVPLME